MTLRNLLLAALITIVSGTALFAQGWDRTYQGFESQSNPVALQLLPLSDGGTLALMAETWPIGIRGHKFSLVRTDATGMPLQRVNFDFGGKERAMDLTATSDGGYAVLYRQEDTSYSFSHFLLRVNAQLQILWNEPVIQGLDWASNITSYPNGFLVYSTTVMDDTVSRQRLYRIDTNGQVVDHHTWGPDSTGAFYLKRLSDGRFITVAMRITEENNAYKSNVLLARFSASGALEAEYPYNPASNASGRCLTATPDGSFVMAGAHNGIAYSVKMDADFNIAWERTYPGFADIQSITALPDGSGYWAVAWDDNFSPSNDEGSVHLLRLDAQGNLLSSRHLTFFEPFSLQSLPDGGCLLGGGRTYEIGIHEMLPRIIRTDADGNDYTAGVRGRVLHDLNADCLTNAADTALERWTVTARDEQGFEWAINSKQDGSYFLALPPGEFKLTARRTYPWVLTGWVPCADTLTVTVLPSDTLNDVDYLTRFDPEPVQSICGTVFRDYDGDCQRDDYEPGFLNWPVELRFYSPSTQQTLVFQAITDAEGNFCITDLNGLDNSYVGSVVGLFDQPGDNLACRTTCAGQAPIAFANDLSAFVPIGLACDTLAPCPRMEVSIISSPIRPCIPSSYAIQYCNKGGLAAENAYLTVTVDPALTVVSSSLPWASAVGNVYVFEVGDVAIDQCTGFSLNVVAPCSDPAGTTYCTEVRAFPDTLCLPPSPDWDGSDIEVQAECTGGEVQFRIRNVGTGNMTKALEYIVIEDNVLRMPGPGQFQLDAGQEMLRTFPADGSFFRLEAEQAPGFPTPKQAVAWVEGCVTGGGNASIGYVNQYYLPDAEPWVDIFCLESVNSYDPNDKNGFPRGYDEQRFIGQNTDIEYVIRFQNTGNAPAIDVEIRDTIPVQFLNPATVRPGASSHGYQFDMQGSGVVVFRFPNIYLPDTSAGDAASQGFVKFRVSQWPDLPIGTQIRNTAAIYFDNNDPVITNQTLHTIGKDFILVQIIDLLNPQIEVAVAPNPVTGWATLSVHGAAPEQPLTFTIWSMTGQPVQTGVFSGTQHRFDASSLPAGMYVFTLQQGAAVLARGKVVRSRP